MMFIIDSKHFHIEFKILLNGEKQTKIKTKDSKKKCELRSQNLNFQIVKPNFQIVARISLHLYAVQSSIKQSPYFSEHD